MKKKREGEKERKNHPMRIWGGIERGRRKKGRGEVGSATEKNRKKGRGF